MATTGTSRYDLLESFNNTSDGPLGGGMVDFSPVGLPMLVGRASIPAGTFNGLGDAQHKYCFAAGTQVLLADGTTRAIEKMEVGMMVLAAPENDAEAKPTACRVVEVYHNAPARLLAVTITAKDQVIDPEPILTTAGHPFYVREKGWVKAQNLVAGDALRTDDGEWARVRSVSDTGRTEPVFNLQVEGSHTYFVQICDGFLAVLVHNASGYIPTDPHEIALWRWYWDLRNEGNLSGARDVLRGIAQYKGVDPSALTIPSASALGAAAGIGMTGVGGITYTGTGLSAGGAAGATVVAGAAAVGAGVGAGVYYSGLGSWIGTDWLGEKLADAIIGAPSNAYGPVISAPTLRAKRPSTGPTATTQPKR